MPSQRPGQDQPSDSSVFPAAALLTGAIGGVAIASRLRQPWRVLGWKRQAGAACFGASTGVCAFYASRSFYHSAEWRGRYLRNSESFQDLEAKWAPALERILSADQRLPQPIEGSEKCPPPGVLQRNGLGMGGSTDQSGPIAQGQEKINTDGPYYTHTVPGVEEPLMMANPNYKWTSPHQIEDLENAIAETIKRREQVANEAKLLWALLADKEAEYYNTMQSLPDDSDVKNSRRVYLETLSSIQVQLLIRTTLEDWFLADSRKRIEQLKSKSTNDGKVAIGYPATSVEPKTTREMLDGQNKTIEQQKEMVENLKMAQATQMANMSIEFEEAANEMVFSPQHGKMLSQKELMLEQRKTIDSALEAFATLQQAGKSIIADAEERARRGSS